MTVAECALGKYPFNINKKGSVFEISETIVKGASAIDWSSIKEKHPDTPLIYFANGGSSYLERQADMKCDMLCVDWKVDMAKARQIVPQGKGISGNVDPLVLLGPEEKIRSEVRKCVSRAGPHHVLNLGHGVIQETPEEAVGFFVDEAKKFKYADIDTGAAERETVGV